MEFIYILILFMASESNLLIHKSSLNLQEIGLRIEWLRVG